VEGVPSAVEDPVPRTRPPSAPRIRGPLRILVCLDGSEAARVALDVIACLPLTPADLLVLLSVVELGAVAPQQLRRRQGEDLDRLLLAAWVAEREAASRHLGDARAVLGTWPTPVRQVVRDGPAIRAIPETADELRADLVVVGPRGRGGIAGLVLGSVAAALPGRVRCPVLVGRPPVGAPERVLLAVDGSAHAAAAARSLAAYPLAGDARVTVATVVGSGTPDGRAAAASAKAVADELAAAGLGTEVAVETGDPRRVVVALARSVRADLVVVGSRGQDGVRGLLLGSVSRHVVAHAPCSVLVAPPPGVGAPSGGTSGGTAPDHPRG
jgi:nucleotide-binding universal stress UspA family protein